MQNVNEQDIITYDAWERHRIPSAYAKNWFQYWSSRHWITTNGRAILDWRVKFDWWVLDHKDHLILSETLVPQPTPAEIHARELQRQREERETAEQQCQAEQNDPVAQAEIAAIQERLGRMFGREG